MLHFSDAARRLHITQPALSRQIQKLEEELGVRLFDRKGRGVVLTRIGELFLEDVVLVLERFDRAVERTQHIGMGVAGVVRLGFVASLTFSLVPALLRKMRAEAPDVRLVLKELGTAQQISALDAAALDIGLVRPPFAGNEVLATKKLLSEPIVVVLPAGHPLAKKEVVNASDLAAEPFVMYPRDMGPGLFDRIISICQRAGFSPKVVQEAGLVPTVVGLVAGGLGVAMVPQSVQYFGAADVEFRQVQDEEAVTDLIAVWREDRASPLVNTVLASLESCAREID